MESLSTDNPLGAALKEAAEDVTVKERHFTTPLSVSAAAQGRSRSPQVRAMGSKGTSQKGGGGKKGKKGQGKGKSHHTVTPEGRQICFAYNSQNERCDGTCNRVHVCQACFGPHPLHMHAAEMKKASTPSPASGTKPSA